MTGRELAAKCDQLAAELGLLQAGCDEDGEIIELEDDVQEDDDES